MSDIRIDQAARLAAEWTSLGSLDFDVTEEITLLPSYAGKDGYKTIDTHYIETPAKQRFMDTSMKGKSGEIARHTATYSDGRRFSVVEYQKDRPGIPQALFIGTSFDNEATRGGSARPAPLRYYFIDKTPLHEALPSSTYLGTDKFIDRSSHSFLFKSVMWSQVRQNLVIHITEDGILPHRVISYKDEEARLLDRPLWSWSATSLASIQGKTVPIKSNFVRYDASRPKQQTSASDMTVRRAEFSKSFPGSTFWRDGDTKIIVFDAVKGKITPPSVRPAETKTVVSEPIRVAQATDYSGYLATGSLIIGVAVLIAGLILWFRRP